MNWKIILVGIFVAFMVGASVVFAAIPTISYANSSTKPPITNKLYIDVNVLATDADGHNTSIHIDFNRSLLLWLKLNSTNELIDYSTWGNNATTYTGTLANYSSGAFGSAVNFTGTGRFTATTNPNLDVIGNQTNMTVEFWAYMAGNQENTHVTLEYLNKHNCISFAYEFFSFFSEE